MADVFYTFRVPFSIPGPLFSGLGSLFVVSLIFIFLDFFDQVYGLGLSVMFLNSMDILYFLVFFIVIITGYVRIFSPKKSERINRGKEKLTIRHALSVHPGRMSAMKSVRQSTISLTGSGRRSTGNRSVIRSFCLLPVFAKKIFTWSIVYWTEEFLKSVYPTMSGDRIR